MSLLQEEAHSEKGFMMGLQQRLHPQDGQKGQPPDLMIFPPQSGHRSPWLLFGMNFSFFDLSSVARDGSFDFVSFCPECIDTPLSFFRILFSPELQFD